MPQTLPTPLLSFKSMASFFTNGYCMNIWTYMYFSKCNTLSPYNATCMYASRAEPGALQWLACSSLGKVTSQNLSIPRLLYSSLCRAEALWVFPCGVRQVHQCHPSSAHVWAGILVGPSDITRRCSHSSLPDPLALSIFLFHFCMSPESWVQSNFFLRLWWRQWEITSKVDRPVNLFLYQKHHLAPGRVYVCMYVCRYSCVSICVEARGYPWVSVSRWHLM